MKNNKKIIELIKDIERNKLNALNDLENMYRGDFNKLIHKNNNLLDINEVYSEFDWIIWNIIRTKKVIGNMDGYIRCALNNNCKRKVKRKKKGSFYWRRLYKKRYKYKHR